MKQPQHKPIKRRDHDSTPKVGRQGRPPQRKSQREPERPTMRHPDEPTFKLPAALLDAWASTVLDFGRLSLKPDQTRPSDIDLVRTIALAEQEEVHHLWEAFTSQREEISELPLNSRKRIVAYMLGFHLANCARSIAAIDRLKTRQAGLMKAIVGYDGPIHISDLGCGTGAVSLALMEHLRTRPSQESRTTVHLVDRNGLLLDAAERGHAILGHGARVMRHRSGLDEYLSRIPAPVVKDTPSLEVFLAGYIWNEIASNERAKRMVIQAFEQRVRKDMPAIFVLLEPANQGPCRSAMELRDILCDMGWATLYPCPHNNPCPMLQRPRDWCYSEASWSRPPIQALIDQGLGVDRSRLASTIHVLATPALMKQLQVTCDTDAVVVGRPAKADRPGFSHLVCDQEGLSSHPAGPYAKIIARGREWKPLRR